MAQLLENLGFLGITLGLVGMDVAGFLEVRLLELCGSCVLIDAEELIELLIIYRSA